MTIIHLSKDTCIPPGQVATIGFFDGVHRGHQYLVEQLRARAASMGMPSMVVTFDRHPRQVLCSDWRPRLLTTLEEKIDLFAQTGIDLLVVLPFDEQMASLSARDFMRQVLKEQLGVKVLMTGYDNRFGHREAGSAEGFDDYVRYGQEMDIDVVCGEGLQMEDYRLQTTDKGLQTSDYRLQTKDEGGPLFVSSSVIRRLLGEGRVEEAALALGRPYSLKGVVVHGEQVGRKIGYPTANISPDACRLIPKNGVYAVRVMLSPLNSQFSTLNSQFSNLNSQFSNLNSQLSNLNSQFSTLNSQFSPLPGMTNIGLRPTFDGHRQTIETHLFDFHGDLYGQPIQLLFMSRLREERQFDSPDTLARQMAEDEKTARKTLNE